MCKSLSLVFLLAVFCLSLSNCSLCYDGSAFILGLDDLTSNIAGGTIIQLKDKVCTAVFPDRFYVQEGDRSSGVGVLGQGGSVGKSLDVVGAVTTVNGERVIAASSVTVVANAPVVKPLLVRQKDIRLSTWWHVKRPDGKWEYVWMPASTAPGLSTIGLLIKTHGKISSIDPSGQYFYIDDASGLKDDTKTNDEYNIGVRVAFDGRSYSKGQYVAVTGISSLFQGTDGFLRTLIKVRQASDIQVLQSP